MAVMGKPLDSASQGFSQVSMAPKSDVNTIANKQKELNDKQKLLNKLTGHKEKSIYVDGKQNQMGKDEFLKLLTYQLKNQDPMNPMENGKLSGELAQFSQLEQLSNLNTKFDNLNANRAMESQYYGASFLGKEVVTTGQTLNYKGNNEEANMMFKLDKAASKVLARVYDSQNNIIGEVWKENIGRGNQTFTWDGTTLDGGSAAKGDYKVQIFAWDETSEPIKVETKVTGTVESVFFENGETVLTVSGKKVFLRDVDSFHLPGDAKMPSENLPIDTKHNQEVKLNTGVTSNLINEYKKNEAPTTGLTNVYDVE